MGDIGKGIGELVEGLYGAAVLFFGLFISLVIVLVLTICVGWSWLFLLIIPVVVAILGFIAYKIVN